MRVINYFDNDKMVNDCLLVLIYYIHLNSLLIKGALSHFRILLSILLIILYNSPVIQVLAAK